MQSRRNWTYDGQKRSDGASCCRSGMSAMRSAVSFACIGVSIRPLDKNRQQSQQGIFKKADNLFRRRGFEVRNPLNGYLSERR